MPRGKDATLPQSIASHCLFLVTIMARLHVVLVHGAYHQPWHFDILRQKLEGIGYTVSVPHLPSSSNEPPPIGTAFVKDVGAVQLAIESADLSADHILVLCHSYGSVPTSQALSQLSDEVRAKIVHVIFLASFVVPQGCSLTSMGIAESKSWARLNECGVTTSVIDPPATFYHDVEPALAKEAAGHLLHHAVECLGATITAEGWKGLKCTHVACRQDRALPAVDAEKNVKILVAERGVERDWEFVWLEGSHSPYLSQPDRCVELIRNGFGQYVVGRKGDEAVKL